MPHLLLVGQANAGKTTLFNQLTGKHNRVGNFHGVTVNKATATIANAKFATVKVSDLPGLNSLVSQQQSSLDQRLSLNALLDDFNSPIVNVVDASNLERELYLTLQLREWQRPMVVLLTKLDRAKAQGKRVDIEALGHYLGCPVVINSPDAAKPEWLAPVLDYFANKTCDDFKIEYQVAIENQLIEQGAANRSQAIIALQQSDQYNLDIELSMAESRYALANTISRQVVADQHNHVSAVGQRLDQWLLNPWIAIPVFIASMYAMFMFTIHIGGAFIDFFDLLTGALLVDGSRMVLSSLDSPAWLIATLSTGVASGLQTVATFIPLIFCLYLFLTLLEQSGYLARAAVVTDRLMQKLGLPGAAFVPMLMGFGCTVPAVMATRTLKQPRERILTAILSHYMVCGARLPVFILIAAAFFQQNAINVVFILYLLGLLVAILVGLLLKSTILAGDNQGFIIELPDYQWPSFSSIFSHTLFKVKQFIFGAGKTIVIVVTLLGFFSSLGTDGTFDNQGSDKAVLSVIGQQITPILAPMGIEQDNWQATVGIFTGLFAKEVLVATLNTLYLAEQAEVEDATIETKLRQALDSVAANLKSVSEYVTDPLGLSAANVSSAEEAAQALDVNLSALQTMQAKFNGQLGAFAYLVFILLYAPCASALGAYSREFGGRWTTFIAVFTTGVAFLIASLVYQVGQWQNSKFSVVIIVLVAVAAYWLLKQQRLADWLKPEQRHVATTANPACHS